MFRVGADANLSNHPHRAKVDSNSFNRDSDFRGCMKHSKSGGDMHSRGNLLFKPKGAIYMQICEKVGDMCPPSSYVHA